jgi:(R,R)-butanediol dehydrogenase/meso-butanediol dehydrogenase/diacetyl reductase/L-iditol 2-dehydrogenase
MQLDEFTGTVFALDDAEAAFAAHMSGKHVKVILQCNEE